LNWKASRALGIVAIIAVIGLIAIALVLATERFHEPRYESDQSTYSDNNSTSGGPTHANTTAQQDQGEPGPVTHETWWGVPADGWVAIFTLFLTVTTLLLWLATREALQDSRRSAERDQRAYVFPTTIALLDGATNEPPLATMINHPGSFIVLKNSGRTPAYDVIHWAEIRVLDRQDEHLLSIPPLAEVSKGWMGASGEINKTITLGRAMDEAEIAAIHARTKAIFVHGKVEYKDVFGQRRETTFRLFYFGTYPAKGATFSFCDQGNMAT
jgi:hypothetical protein